MANDQSPTDAQVAQFDMVQPLLAAAHKEMAELSKKKQDGLVNELKIRHINRLLEAAEGSLNGDASTAFLERLDEEAIPQNSDAVLVLSQWLAAMEQFKKRHSRVRRIDSSVVHPRVSEGSSSEPESGALWARGGLVAVRANGALLSPPAKTRCRN